MSNDLDHDTSLTLAAEVGNALLTENTLLKQQLHDLKTQKSESQVELEDKLKLSEEITGEFKRKISMLEKEMEFIKTKLKSECKLKEDIIQQSENEKCGLTTQINNVLSTNSDLRNKIKKLEAEMNDKSLLINSLNETNYQLERNKHTIEVELEENKSLLKEVTSNYKETLTKIFEQESTARRHLKHLENILEVANLQPPSKFPHETNHQMITQKNKHLYSTSLQVEKNKILQLQCPTLEKELAQENLLSKSNAPLNKQCCAAPEVEHVKEGNGQTLTTNIVFTTTEGTNQSPVNSLSEQKNLPLCGYPCAIKAQEKLPPASAKIRALKKLLRTSTPRIFLCIKH
ncbi:hypothetical protein J6590_043002 [Homalodisca vitripennis]|nr:hypothetical protein J6590_043002 [Homalodisca vitripennis]